jgi:hypothetical protein
VAAAPAAVAALPRTKHLHFADIILICGALNGHLSITYHALGSWSCCSTCARKPLSLSQGMNGPHCLPVSLPSARIVLKHLANLIVFGRSVVKRSHGQKHERILDLVLYQKRDVQLAGAVSPHKHFRQPFVAGPAGHRQGATGAGCRQLQSGSAGGWAA